MHHQRCAAVGGSRLYVRVSDQIYEYKVNTCSWSRLPDSPSVVCPSVIVNNLLTLVGGNRITTTTNQLFSLTGEGSSRRWTEEFPPMPTKRWGSTALCTGAALIVAGGKAGVYSLLKIVEVMNTATKQWSTAADLPQPVCDAPAALCGDHIYVLRNSNDMYTCSIHTLIQSCESTSASMKNRESRVWKEAAAPPVTETTCVSIHGRLLTIGGRDSDGKPTAAVYMYNPTTDSWEVISRMRTPRYHCIAAVLPNNQLMVVGGWTATGYSYVTETDSVEFAKIE